MENEKSFAGYRVLKKIGSGGMATVYKCFSDSENRVVAVKVPVESLAGAPSFVEAFKREARAAMAVEHPNVGRVLAVGDDPEAPIIVMEYVKGRSLAATLAERGKLSPGEALRIAAAVASALQAAHDAGIVHRDVKASNVIIDEGGRPKLLDFGIAGALESVDVDTLAEQSSVAGTAEYMSPEQCQGGEVGAPSDIYSLGVLLYEMLTGCVPFTGPRLSVVLSQVQDTPAKPSQAAEGMSGEIDELVMKMLEKNPQDRFETAAGVAARIGAIADVAGLEVSEGGAEVVSAQHQARYDGAASAETVEEDERPTKLWTGYESDV